MHPEKSKIPWPTKAVMTQIYEKHFWGGNDFDFYSGKGSHDPKIITPYLKAVIAFLNSHNNALTVCDLGCGDFNVAKQLVPFTSKYIGVDIVDALIKRNKVLFTQDNLEFQCLDIATDELPKADCVVLRQVLQHLSNVEIKKVVNKLMNYKYIILTEHLPLGNFEPNKDIITGQGIRLKQNSGVDVLAPPFNFKIKEEVMHLNIILEPNKDCIVTSIYKCF